MTDIALQLEHVDKVFPGGAHALRDVSLTVPTGAIYGFLGPNGSGKTTAVRLLNGLLAPTGGIARLLGRAVQEHGPEIHRLCGVLTETAASYEHLDAVANLHFFGRVYGLSDAEARARTDELLRLLELDGARGREVRHFSTGMRKRLSLARALLHRPRLLFLDEPTSGLDPEGSRNVNGLIRKLAQETGVTVFLCTHHLAHAEELCTRYGFIHQGRMLGEGTFDELLARQGHRATLALRGQGLPADPAATRVSDDTWHYPITGDDDVPAILGRILQGGGRVYEARQLRWDLEQLYFSFVEGRGAH